MTASVAAALGLASTAAAQTGNTSQVQLYGQVALGVTVRNHVSGGGHLTDMANSQFAGSLWGLRGTEDLGGGMSAVFRLESGLNADTGANTSANKFWNRQSFVGLNLNPDLTVTVGRQFHAAVDRVIQTFDVYGVGGTTLAVAPNGLFGVNRFVGNDTRVDDSVKLRLRGPAGITAGLSAGLNDGAGRSYSADLAQITPGYGFGAIFVSYDAPTLVPRTGAQPRHQVWAIGGNVSASPFRLYASYTDSKLDPAQQPAAPAALLVTQKNRILSLGASWQAAPLILIKASLFHDTGKSMNGVTGRDGNKETAVASAEYFLSKRTSLHIGAFTNRFTGGYKVDPVNIAGLSRDPQASSTSGLTAGMRHDF